MVNRIAGRVLSRETGTGISDLAVLALDIDHPNIDLEVAPSAQTRAYDRLGSVLTDREGRFTLDFGDDLFTKKDPKEGRPDIEILVLAPDRPTSPTDPLGLPLKDRLLFRTRFPQFEAGRIESFVVHLPEAALRSADVLRVREPHSILSAVYLRDAFKQEKQRQSDLRSVRMGVMAERRPAIAAERTAVTTILGSIAADGLSDRGGMISFDYTPEFALAETERRRTDLLRSIEDTRFVVRARLSDDDIEALGGTAGALASGGTLHATFCEVARRLGSDGSLLRNRDLLTEVQTRRAIQALDAPAAGSPGRPPVTGGDETPTTTRESLAAAVLDRLAAQVSQLPQFSGIQPGGGVGELERIKETVRRLELSGGPANVVASHDVNVLQIAFESVWTTFFDRDFEAQVRDLYRQVVAIREDYAVDPLAFESTDSVQALRRMFREIAGAIESLPTEPVPREVGSKFPWITREQWSRLNPEGQEALLALADETNRVTVSTPGGSFTIPDIGAILSGEMPPDERARQILATHMNNPLARAEKLIADLERRLAEAYKFHVFVPDTINYGILLTYRQEWSPLTYQVGRLVETMPLAPGESREFSVKRSRKSTRRERRADKLSRESERESQYTTRTEAEALDAATRAINNKFAVEGTFNIAIGEISGSSEFSQNFTQESRRLQKTFAEITRKAADKVKQESELTIETEIESAFETASKNTISNPNNEISVTYLLYELERRFQVASRLHRVQPVVLVALDVPMPNEIDDSWLIEYSWILRDILLDPDLAKSLDYLEEGRTGDTLDLELRRAVYLKQKDITEALEVEYNGMAGQARARRDEIVRYMRGEGEAAADETPTGQRIAAAIFSGGLSELFGGGETNTDERLEARRKAAERALEYLETQVDAKGRALSEAQIALQEATGRFSEALKRQAERDTCVSQLRLHVRDNIYHYMQHIWMNEHPDQRFFSLYDKEVEFFPPDPAAYTLRTARPDELDDDVPGVRRGGTAYVLEFTPPRPPASADAIPKRKLCDIADLDRPLGFRGNYIIFPLRTCSQLTDVMLHAYVDDYYGVRDPADGRAYTGQDLLAYARDVWNDPDVGLTADDKTRLAAMIAEALLERPDAVQEIVLPTGQLFMEALKGDQTLLEPFKLAHRGLDVMKVEEELRAMRIDALRRASRISGDELDVDPTGVEKFVIVRGNADTSVDT